MKITKKQLKKIIKEELMNEADEMGELSDETGLSPSALRGLMAEHGVVVEVYYPRGDISKLAVEFEDGHVELAGGSDEPHRYR